MEMKAGMNLIQDNERLRAALRAAAKASSAAEVGLIVDAALSQQAEPTLFGMKVVQDDTMQPNEFKLAYPQQAEPAPAQDEREAATDAAYAAVVDGGWSSVKEMGSKMFQAGAEWVRATRPAKTEQQPVYAIPCRKYSGAANQVPACRSDCSCNAAPQPEQSGLVEAWSGMKAIPVSAVEYEAIYRHNMGASPTSVVPGDGMTAKSGVSYIVSAALSAQGDKS